MTQVTTLQDWMIDELKDLYSAENQILNALPKMEKAATLPALKKAFATHLQQTKGHVKRLEQIFESLGKSPSGKKCKGMEGVIKEGAEVLDAEMPPEIRDVALISAAQRVEHYEMAAYGTARTYAEELGNENIATLLAQTLDEEKETDKLLTQLAESQVNVKASAKVNSR
jgi:ferritin-like metal-binding protein YciE